MRFRLLAALPLSLSIVGLLLVCAATLVSAIEGKHAAEPTPGAPIRVGESRCDVLCREIHALSHAVSPCELAPECHGSPLLCPVALDSRIEREYERLRDALHADCGLPRGLLDYAWEAGAQAVPAGSCELTHDGWKAAARGEARPASYSF